MTLILSGTNGLSDVDGSAANPAIKGTDANTGIFFGADTVGIATGGTAAITVNSSQNTVFNSTGSVTLSSGTTAQRPGSPTVGMMRYNTTIGAYEGYTSVGWQPISTVAYTAEYLVVAGGGGGGYNIAGGGGAGGLLSGIVPVPVGVPITITVGGGGADSASGQNSVFGVITTRGGGYGATPYNAGAGIIGGSGGGGTYESIPQVGQGTFGQGNAGGVGNDYNYNAGGGGGAGTVGLNWNNDYGGGGGAGIASQINGTRTVYAGGGGGSTHSAGTAGGYGGAGGGGTGGKCGGTTRTAGTVNTGGGGGGGEFQVGGAAGGSGIVIIRYPNIFADAASTLNGSKTSITGFTVYTFTTTGTITF